MRNLFHLVTAVILLAPMLATVADGGMTAAAPTSSGPTNDTARGVDSSAAASIAADALRLPATFVGDLPCADCEAVRHHLDLWPDQVFRAAAKDGRGRAGAERGRAPPHQRLAEPAV